MAAICRENLARATENGARATEAAHGGPPIPARRDHHGPEGTRPTTGPPSGTGTSHRDRALADAIRELERAIARRRLAAFGAALT